MSLTSKLSLTVAQCLSFAKDKLFDRARGALQERGKSIFLLEIQLFT